MNIDMIPWHQWAILGLALVIAELLIPAFVLVWFGLGALIVAVLAAIVPEASLTVELLVWIAASVAMVLLWFKVFKPHQHKVLTGRSSAEAIGEVGILLSDMKPFSKAKVKFQMPLMGSDTWECVSDEPISANSRVKVVSVEGSILKVTKEKNT